MAAHRAAVKPCGGKAVLGHELEHQAEDTYRWQMHDLELGRQQSVH